MKEITQVAAQIATIVAAIGGLILLYLTTQQLRLNAKQLRLSADAQTADFWLQLRQMFKDHEDVHRKLIPRGDWWDAKEPVTQNLAVVHNQRSEDEEVEEEEEGEERLEVTWAQGKIVKRGTRYVVSWFGDKQDRTVDELVELFDDLNGPKEDIDWREVENYMGLFEHCEAMFRRELIDLPTFKEIYRYRLINIMSNRRIVIAKLGCNREGWQGFIQLLERVGIEVPPEQNLRIEEFCDREGTSVSSSSSSMPLSFGQ